MRTIIFILFLASTNLSRLLAYDDDNVNNETESPHELDIYRRDDENYGETIKLVNRRSNSKSKNKNKITKPQPSGGGGGGSGNTNLARKNEIDSFFSKLETASKKGEKQLEEFTVDKIRSLIGDGNHLIVFDCQNPSYMKNKKAQNLPKELAKQIKIKNNCSLEVDNLWHVGSDSSSLTTFNVKSKSLSKPQLPFKKLTMHFMNLNMCDDFMKFMKHPGYFLKIYKKPTVCLNDKIHYNVYVLKVQSSANELERPKQIEATAWQGQGMRRKHGRNKHRQNGFKRFQFPAGGMGGCPGGG